MQMLFISHVPATAYVYINVIQNINTGNINILVDNLINDNTNNVDDHDISYGKDFNNYELYYLFPCSIWLIIHFPSKIVFKILTFSNEKG